MLYVKRMRIVYVQGAARKSEHFIDIKVSKFSRRTVYVKISVICCTEIQLLSKMYLCEMTTEKKK